MKSLKKIENKIQTIKNFIKQNKKSSNKKKNPIQIKLLIYYKNLLRSNT